MILRRTKKQKLRVNVLESVKLVAKLDAIASVLEYTREHCVGKIELPELSQTDVDQVCELLPNGLFLTRELFWSGESRGGFNFDVDKFVAQARRRSRSRTYSIWAALGQFVDKMDRIGSRNR
jgi:predicted transcriptional regulator